MPERKIEIVWDREREDWPKVKLEGVEAVVHDFGYGWLVLAGGFAFVIQISYLFRDEWSWLVTFTLDSGELKVVKGQTFGEDRTLYEINKTIHDMTSDFLEPINKHLA